MATTSNLKKFLITLTNFVGSHDELKEFSTKAEAVEYAQYQAYSYGAYSWTVDQQ